MGLFSDKCEALIDINTKRFLQGDALAYARQNPDAPRCGNSVKKAARFCNKCGSSAPGGWWKCPSCKKWVGSDANFCWSCKKALHPDSRATISDGVWQRQPGMFAQRIEVAELRRLIEKGLNIEIGTVALLIEAGKIEVLEPGQHKPETLLRQLKSFFMTPAPQTVVLVEDGDVVLPLRFSDLRSSEDLILECYTEACFRFVPSISKAFLENLLKGTQHLTYEGLADWMRQEIRGAVLETTVSSTVEDLVKDPQRRLKLEDALRQKLALGLERAGVELVRLASIEFTGEAYEELRNQAAEVEVTRRTLEFKQRARELTEGDKMGEFKSEADLAEYIAQLAQEKGVSDTLREHELSRLKQVHRHELEKNEAAFQMTAEIEQADHQILISTKKTDADIQEAVKWLKVRQEKQRLDLEQKKAEAEVLAGHDIKTLIALLPDNDRRQQLLELAALNAKAGQSPEQILALAAEKSPAAAEALAKMREVKREDFQREFDDRKKLSDESAARLEHIISDALKAMAESSRPKISTIYPGFSSESGKES